MRIKIKRSRIDTIIYFGFIYFGILIDNIVGNQMRVSKEDSNLSKIYRAVFLIFLLYTLVKKNFTYNKKYIITFFLFMLLPIFQGFYNFSMEGIITDELYIIKLIFPIYLIIAGYNLIENEIMNREDIEVCINFMSWVFPISVLVPYILGLGFRAYSDKYGYSGFYYATNELSIVLSVMFIIRLEKVFQKVTLKSFLGCFISIVAAILTGTKASVIVIFLAIIYFFTNHKLGKKKIIYYFSIVILMLVSYTIIQLYWKNDMQAIVQRWQFRLQQTGNNLVDFLFSGRNRRIPVNMQRCWDSIGSIFWGWGYYDQVISNINMGLIEMDIFDIFFCYGIVTVIFIYKFYLGNLIRCRNCDNKIYNFAIFCMLLYSTAAGHTLFSAMPGTILAILYLSISFKDNGEIIRRR